MNTANLNQTNEQNKGIDFSATLAKVLPRQNGTPAGVSALAESLKRGNAYVEAQQRINDLCNPSKTQLVNTLIQEA